MQNFSTSAGRSTAHKEKAEIVLLGQAAILEEFRVSLPFYIAKVPAGFPSPADDYLDSALNLHDYVVKHPAATYFVRAEGDSMLEAGIFPGDLLVVDRSIPPAHDKIVIAAIDGQLTVKRLSKINDKVQLLPANTKYPPINITGEEDLIIWGVVSYVIHKIG